MAVEFHKTPMGQAFYMRTLPQIAKGIESRNNIEKERNENLLPEISEVLKKLVELEQEKRNELEKCSSELEKISGGLEKIADRFDLLTDAVKWLR